MKKTIIVFLMIIISYNHFDVHLKAYSGENQNQLTTLNIEELVESFILTFDDQTVDAKYVKTLRDVFDNDTFALLSLDNIGYAVVVINNMNIVEINTNDNICSGNTSNIVYYLGPELFFDKIEYESLILSESSSIIYRLDSIRESTKRLINEENYFQDLATQNAGLSSASPVIIKPSIIIGGSEISQYSDSTMSIFKNEEWHNDNNYGKDYLFDFFGREYGICGTISTAMALTVLDKYKNESIIIHSPYQFPDPKYAEWLIMLLKPKIEPPLPGSFGSDIIRSINWFYNSIYSVRISPYYTPIETTSESIYKTSILNGIPLIMYLDVIDNTINPYGLHWVMAYKYVEYNNALWFKAADNWGNLSWINRNWIGSAVYFKYY